VFLNLTGFNYFAAATLQLWTSTLTKIAKWPSTGNAGNVVFCTSSLEIPRTNQERLPFTLYELGDNGSIRSDIPRAQSPAWPQLFGGLKRTDIAHPAKLDDARRTWRPGGMPRIPAHLDSISHPEWVICMSTGVLGAWHLLMCQCLSHRQYNGYIRHRVKTLTSHSPSTNVLNVGRKPPAMHHAKSLGWPRVDQSQAARLARQMGQILGNLRSNQSYARCYAIFTTLHSIVRCAIAHLWW
jgi:hypothetical protein